MLRHITANHEGHRQDGCTQLPVPGQLTGSWERSHAGLHQQDSTGVGVGVGGGGEGRPSDPRGILDLLEASPDALQAKYMVLRVSWWICTALASAWGSRPLLCPETWLPSALLGGRQDVRHKRLTPPGQGTLPPTHTGNTHVHAATRSAHIETWTLDITAEGLRAPPPHTHTPVVFFVHQVVTGAERHQVGVVGRCRDGDGARAAHVRVAQLVGEQLELVAAEAVVVPQDVVVGGAAGALRGVGGGGESSSGEARLSEGAGLHLAGAYLDPSVAAEVKVKLVGVGDVRVHGGACRNVSTSTHLGAETRGGGVRHTQTHAPHPVELTRSLRSAQKRRV